MGSPSESRSNLVARDVAVAVAARRLHGRAGLRALRASRRPRRTRKRRAGRRPSRATASRAATGGRCSTIRDSTRCSAQVEVSNQTIKAAEARVREARALTQQAQAAYFPDRDRERQRDARRRPRQHRRQHRPAAAAWAVAVRNSYNVALDVNWELDLWGRVRRTVEAGEATAQASAADLEAAKLSAQALLAEDYFLLRAQDAQIRLLDRHGRRLPEVAAADAQPVRGRRRRARRRRAGRDAAQVDAGAGARRRRAARPARACDRRAARQAAGGVSRFAPEAVATTFPPIPPGLPSELLERRPDIAAAERRTAAANAQVGVAEAAFFPSLTLSATGGFQSSVLSQLFSLAQPLLVARPGAGADDIRRGTAPRADGAGDRDLRRECRQLSADGPRRASRRSRTTWPRCAFSSRRPRCRTRRSSRRANR